MCCNQKNNTNGQHCINGDHEMHHGENCSVLNKSVFNDLKQQIIKISEKLDTPLHHSVTLNY